MLLSLPDAWCGPWVAAGPVAQLEGVDRKLSTRGNIPVLCHLIIIHRLVLPYPFLEPSNPTVRAKNHFSFSGEGQLSKVR